MKTEKNISEFNKDVKTIGHYQYTGTQQYSLVTARQRQVDAIAKTLHQHFPTTVSMLDIGCGDGKSTFLLMEYFKPKSVVGFDLAQVAVDAANKNMPPKYKKFIRFETFSIYDLAKKVKKNTFDVAIIWGVLHHVYQPQKAIAAIGKVASDVIVLEPNGYNPILKIIEKISPYHRLHEERSYPPVLLNSWFKKQGYSIKKKEYCCIVPYFCPELLARFLKLIEPVIEKTPILRELCCGAIVIYYSKR